MKKKLVAFTLVELMVVIAIIAILAVVGITSYATALRKARDSKKMSDLEHIAQALVLYRSDNGSYPVSMNALYNNKYLNETDITVACKDCRYKASDSNKNFILCIGIENTSSAKYKLTNSATNTFESCTTTNNNDNICKYWCVTNP